MTKPFSELRMGMPAQAQQSAHVRAQQMLRQDSDILEPPCPSALRWARWFYRQNRCATHNPGIEKNHDSDSPHSKTTSLAVRIAHLRRLDWLTDSSIHHSIAEALKFLGEDAPREMCQYANVYYGGVSIGTKSLDD